LPQNTQVSHKQGPSMPVHIALQAWQHSLEELNLWSDPHFTAPPQSSNFSTPLQHPPSLLSSANVKGSKFEPLEFVLELRATERTV
jgi:hypothetical protein